MKEIAYISGDFVELDKASISLEDRGFQFGDGVYEVIKLYDGILFKGEEHFKRLINSAELIRINLDYSVEDLKEIAFEVIKRSDKNKSGSLYIQVTRGVAPRDHNFSYTLEPTLVMYLLPPKSLPNEIREKGVSVVTLVDNRWGCCNIKTINLLPNILASQEASEKGAFEGIFISDNDIVLEGTGSNIFIVKDGVIITHPVTNKILSGITREIVFELARERFSAVEDPFSLEDLYNADEVFITSTTKEVLGVVEVDGKKIGDGVVGDVTKELNVLYREYKSNPDNF
ncbi:D-amino-acid transaminase [Halonatronum saccharophilum]|uniref:D-amino-acid transaminase n=1 Tax=Halonatronum saccharophilum TaxID=150060 RepID=UPI0004852146|nr:D-amino-acid transaminase [Halonatronum saccharophilum]